MMKINELYIWLHFGESGKNIFLNLNFCLLEVIYVLSAKKCVLIQNIGLNKKVNHVLQNGIIISNGQEKKGNFIGINLK